MLCADACVPTENNNVFSDIILNTITLEVISEIQKELETCDLVSLVFLLYDVPDTALQRLIVLQRVSKDIEGNHLDLLTDWALHAQKLGSTWRQQFLEALSICQLFSTLKKLGCHVPTIKKHYSSHEPQMNSFNNPMKIALYKLCENMTSYTFNNLKKTLESFNLNVMQYDTCELVFLELMCQKFITVNHSNCEKGVIDNECKVEKITNIIDRFPELNQFTNMFKEIERKMNEKNKHLDVATTSTQAPDVKSNLNTKDSKHVKPEELNDIFDMINGLDHLSIDLESDKNALKKNSYIIKKKERVGICCIINQEVFYPSKDSIERDSANKPLEDRTGSTKDKIMLEKTMRSLNFEIMTKENLSRKEMLAFIQEVLQKKVTEDDSVFMLCILSHGIKGHVYAADSVAIKVDYIQNMLDDAPLLRDIPKVMILESCQVEADDEPHGFASDGPQYTLRKTDFLVYWATSPELEAFRSPKYGSLFIQILCGTIEKSTENEHLFDLFTEVTNKVTALCINRKCNQVPIFLSTLRKKLFLHSPKSV